MSWSSSAVAVVGVVGAGARSARGAIGVVVVVAAMVDVASGAVVDAHAAAAMATVIDPADAAADGHEVYSAKIRQYQKTSSNLSSQYITVTTWS